MIDWNYSAPRRDAIADEIDAKTLKMWYSNVIEEIENIKAAVWGFRHTGTTNEDWSQRVGKRAGYLRGAARWIELRMIALDLPVPYLPSDPRQAELRRLDAENKMFRAALKAAGVPIPKLPAAAKV